MLIDAIAARKVGLVDVNARGRLPRPATAHVGCPFHTLTYRVIEDEHAVRVQRGAQEDFDSGIVDLPDFLIVVKTLHGGRMPHERKTLAIQRRTCRDLPRVEDWHG